MTILHTGDIRGREVIDADGEMLGEIADVDVDDASWRVTGLVVELERDVARDLHVGGRGLSRPRLTFKPERVQAMGDRVILNLVSDDVAALLRQQD